ncbi:hypothetical protein CBF34_11080 [Vagococcus penaei]|uniref:Uncharacterized protein n=1 Tax=Vagococcus penaei TaxID=633807 RepID=A0A1Q2D5L3_9ENTE|nr:hypothetical protein [Vagococcus penaei]AQP53643.1 hypothetical protein BW732_04930 [Vagococcus penaei]RST97340.1 hypothetical protein CBF34_11080 [Vagococcus penaei]
MSDNHGIVPNIPIPTPDSHQDVPKEIILKDNFNQDRLKHLNDGPIGFILPDEIKVKDKKEKGRI